MSTTLPLQDFGPMSVNDALNWMCGDIIAEGAYRKVFPYGPDPSRFVVKWEKGVTRFCNITEYQIWEELCETEIGKWLAPVRSLSPCGIWLLQERCMPMGLADRPKRVPEFFADIKPENWGLLGGKPVCFDYGNHALFTKAARRSRLKTVYWLR
jgi:hypothetical protein